MTVPTSSDAVLVTPQDHATELFAQGRVLEASECLSEAIQKGESADLWNDWAVVQLSLAEQALRRAIELGHFHPDATTNLGLLLFTMGKREDAAALLKQSLAWSTGPALAHVQTLLRLCSASPIDVSTDDDRSPNRLGCCCGKTPLMQRGQKIGRARGKDFYQASRCKSCGFMSFAAPSPEFLAEYYKGEYTNAAASWYNADIDYDQVRCEARAQDVLSYVDRYCGGNQPVIHECGCSFGGTVAKLQSLGFQATGTDLNSTAIREGAKKGNKWIFAESEREFFQCHNVDFHAVYLYHALEHMPSPVSFLKDIRHAVQKSGIVFIAVPNAVNYFSLAKSFSENSWFAYPDHLNYFSPGSLPCLARAAGYSILEMETRLLASSQEAAETLFTFKPESYQWQLTERLVQHALMGHELRFVLTPTGSCVSERFAAQIQNTHAICENAKQQEVRMLDFCAQ
jgi:2-polyprenyl-3-methyl-5-hydroxy-6-metoxy-1,4-benzoquinol methylase